jgi:hypothetical protein
VDDGQGNGRVPASRADVIAVLRRHGISGGVAAALWTAASNVRRRTVRRGIEHSVTLDAESAQPVGPMLSGTSTMTDLTDHVLRFRAGHEYVQLHTHPSSPSFSALDIRVLADHPPIRTMIAVGADGTWHVTSRLDGTSIGNRRAVFDDFLDELSRLEEAGVTPPERPHIVMEYIAARHGLLYDRVRGRGDGQTTS